jgi:hypothetical protein
MTDPKRWSEDETELGDGELRLLRAGLKPGVPRGAKRAVWIALAAQLPSAVAAATTAVGTGTAGALTGASLVKAASIGVLLGATTMTAVTVVERHAAPSRLAEPAKALPHASSALRASVPARPSVPSIAPAAPLAEPPAVASSPPSGPERTRAPAEPARAVAATLPASSVATFPDETARTQHDAESRKVATAQSLLRSGQPRAALLVLEETRRDFPSGELSQEREALAIESLRVLGNAAEARRRAEAFLTRYPASPHAALARRALENPAP